MKISIIGGGNIGGAIAKGILAAQLPHIERLIVSHPSLELRNRVEQSRSDVVLTTDNRLAAEADMIIIAVKPWTLESVINEIREVDGFGRKTIISIVAGVTIDSILDMASLKSDESPTVFRIIPNTAISLGQSATFICSNHADREQMDFVKSLFDTMGRSFVVEERLMSAVTALASCGIAYILKYIDASIKGGVEIGIPSADARNIIIQTIKGALTLLETDGTAPQTEIDKVTTPGGLTLKGLDAMNKRGFDEAVLAGLKASLSK